MDENVAIVNVTQKQQHIAVQGIGGQRGPQGPKGDAGAGLQISGSVDTYAELPNDLTEADAGKAYFVQADGKLYVWSGVRFPTDGQGSNFVGPEGPAGPSGFTPTATVSKSGTTTTITITDKNGTTTAEVEDGDTLTDGIINGAANNATTVEGSKIALSTIGTPNIRDSAITTNKLADNSVDASKLADQSVGSSKIATGGVETSNVANNAITNDKIAPNISSLKLAVQVENVSFAFNIPNVYTYTVTGQLVKLGNIGILTYTGYTGMTIGPGQANIKAIYPNANFASVLAGSLQFNQSYNTGTATRYVSIYAGEIDAYVDNLQSGQDVNVSMLVIGTLS